MDWHGLVQLAKEAKTSTADYIGFRINGKPSILTHFGFWGEFVRLNALKRVFETTPVGTPAHEHVTIHVYTHSEEYKCQWIECPAYLQGRDDIRLTIDTPEDFENAQKVYSGITSINKDFTLKDIVAYLDAHEDIKQSMLKNISQNKK
jgi:spore coat polysaccharide biosynthesis protein SpsF